jgi:hypothetical protein
MTTVLQTAALRDFSLGVGQPDRSLKQRLGNRVLNKPGPHGKPVFGYAQKDQYPQRQHIKAGAENNKNTRYTAEQAHEYRHGPTGKIKQYDAATLSEEHYSAYNQKIPRRNLNHLEGGHTAQQYNRKAQRQNPNCLAGGKKAD